MMSSTSTSLYQSELTAIWSRAVDPAGVGLPIAIATELSSYTGQRVDDVLECMANGKEDLVRLWEQRRVDPSDPSQVTAFYKDQFVEAYELADWHCGRTNGHPPLSYPHAARVAKQRGLRTALDFGSGIGTGTLCLLDSGCEVDCADIANELLMFVKHRVERRGRRVGVIDLSAGQVPAQGAYDLITCFDVLEHVPDQRAKLLELQSYLRPGGHLVVNLMHNSSDPGRPMHVSSAPNWLAWIRKTQLVPDWSLFFSGREGPVQTFVRRRFGTLRNGAGSVVDFMQRLRSA